MRTCDFRDYGPVPWWAWTGRMRKPEMLRQIKLLKQQGIDEFFIFALYGLEKPAFLSNDWFDYVGFTLECCRQVNMKVWIYDDLNWPSGSAAGRLLREHPECRSKALVMSRIHTGVSMDTEQHPDPLAVFTGNRNLGYQRCNNPNIMLKPHEKNETLVFEVKYNNKQLLNTRGTLNSLGERGYFDLLSEKSVRCWMSYIHEEYWRRFAPEFGKTLRGFFFDEPYVMPLNAFGDEHQSVPWTENFSGLFLDLYGYDLQDFLPELFLDINHAEKVRNDYWRLISESAGAGLGVLGKWCEEHGVLSTGHGVYEEPKFQRLKLLITPTMHDLLKHHSAPGMDLLGSCTSYAKDALGIWYGKEEGVERNFIITAKQLTSSARYSGATRTMAEAMGVRSWGGLPEEQKRVMDWLAGMGVNLLNDNSFIYSIAGFRKRGIAGKHFTQPYYALYHLFSDYCRRVSEFAAFGQLHTSLAVLLPDTTIRAFTAAANTEPIRPSGDCCEILLQTVDALTRNHLDFELLFTPILENATPSSGCLKVPNAAFSTVLVPRPAALTSLEVKKLHLFSSSGGRVIWVGNRPEIIPDQTELLDDMLEWINSIPCWNEQDLSKDAFPFKLCAMQENVKTPVYRLQGSDATNVQSALREMDGEFRLFLANHAPTKAEFKLQWFEKPFHTLQDTSETSTFRVVPTDTQEIVLQPFQSIILGTADTANALPLTEMPLWGKNRKTVAMLPDEWDYELSNPNITQICFSLGLPSVSGTIHFDVPVSRAGRHGMEFSPAQYEYYYLAGEFDLLGQPPPDFGIFCDDGSVERIELNGQELKASCNKELWDTENRFWPAAFATTTGKNHLQVKVRTSFWNKSSDLQIFPAFWIEPIVLAGSFAAEFHDRNTILKPLPAKLHIGDISEQGFPQYIGKIGFRNTFHWDGKQTHVPLRLCCEAAATLNCELNQVMLGEKMWGPYCFSCDHAMIPGKNTVKLEITTTLGNLLRHAYFGRYTPTAVCGLLSPVLIQECTVP